MKKIFLLNLLLASALVAQDVGKIAGFVRNRATNEPLAGANVIVKGTTMGAAAALDGVYFILHVPPGVYEVSASAIGYQTLTQREVIVNVGRTTTLNFSLAETTVEISQEIVVTAVRPDILPERTSSSEIVRAAEVLEIPGIRDLADVLALSADVLDGHFRGGREGEELYNLAGMGIVNPLTNARAFIPIMSAVEEVEVITSGFSAQYGNAQSGVINIAMKEGYRENWQSRVESRVRLPGYKHWGGSVFEINKNPYLQLLDSSDEWAGNDPVTDRVFYDFIAYGYSSQYRDTLQAAQIAHALWKQARRNLNEQYDDLWDHSLDASIGGPLANNARLFLAARIENEWPIIPPQHPDRSRQVMGNLVYDLGNSVSVRLSGAHSRQQGYGFRGVGSSSYADFRYWVWDRLIGSSKFNDDNLQLGIRLTHAISPSTYYELKFNRLATQYRLGADVIDPSRFTEDVSDRGTWRYFNTPDFFRVGYMDNDFRDEKTQTFSIDGSLTSQVTSSHMLLAGTQINFYDVDVYNRTGLSSPSQAVDEIYRAKPFEWAIYAQDKMEFEGMIANLGLRFDAYNQNVDYYVDQFSPIRNPNYDPLRPPVGNNRYYDPALAAIAKTPTVTRLQPRIGISFPVSVSTVFHLNYGSFLQRPSFERSIFIRAHRSDHSPLRLGNPRLKPQDTKSYDVGVAHALGEGFTLDVSGYYKDVKNLIELAYFFDVQQTVYETFLNRDYADIRGFRITLNKRRGAINGSIRYNYGVATGKSSTPFDAPPIYRERPAEGQEPVELPDPKDILLDFDRTHNFIVELSARSPAKWGLRVLGFHPFERLNLSVKSNARSGRPYTYDAQGLGLRFNKRAPIEHNTDVKITRQLPRSFGANASFYVEIFNLFNQKIYSYNTVFQNPQNVLKYETSREALKWYDMDPPFLVDQTFLIYNNGPRSIYLGLVINL